jgi:hypothetical protein
MGGRAAARARVRNLSAGIYDENVESFSFKNVVQAFVVALLWLSVALKLATGALSGHSVARYSRDDRDGRDGRNVS